jgi:hypothetical protein
MTTQEIITLAKEKLGRDISDQEAQDYLDGKTAIPDEALDLVSGGGCIKYVTCSRCGSTNIHEGITYIKCLDCGLLMCPCCGSTNIQDGITYTKCFNCGFSKPSGR